MSSLDSSSPLPRAATRIDALNGLRGWAAISVVVFHFTWELFGTRFELFRHASLALFVGGGLSIAVFFFISGYVLTVGGWRAPDKSRIRRQLAKRYVRLTVPVIINVALVWALMMLGLTAHAEAGEILSNRWMQRFLPFEASIGHALSYALVYVYTTHYTRAYNPMLWTMATQFWGSLVVLTMALAERGGQFIYLAFLVLIVLNLVYPSLAFAYLLGALAALLQRDGRLWAFNRDDWAGRVAMALIALALVGRMLSVISGPSPLIIALLSGVVVLAAVTSSAASRFLSNPLSQFLGSISFPIYLVHFPILVSLTSYLIVWTHEAGLFSGLMALAIALVSIAVSIGAAMLMLPVENFAVQAADRLADRLGALFRFRGARRGTKGEN